MKKMMFLLAFVVGANAQAGGLPSELSKYLNKSGKFISLIDGKPVNDEHGTSCQVLQSPHGNYEDSIYIQSVAYFAPSAFLDGASKSVNEKGVTIFSLNDSGKRPGGSACGDMVPMLSYKKTVEEKGGVLVIRQKIRCMFEKTEIVQGCDVR